MMAGMDDKNDPDDAIALEAMTGLERYLSHKLIFQAEMQFILSTDIWLFVTSKATGFNAIK